jgi:hypothetical protein
VLLPARDKASAKSPSMPPLDHRTEKCLRENQAFWKKKPKKERGFMNQEQQIKAKSLEIASAMLGPYRLEHNEGCFEDILVWYEPLAEVVEKYIREA